jgi:hypothetical protein
MEKTTEANKALVLEAFDTLFNKRDYTAAEHYWSSNYIQHSAHIPPGRDGLFNLIRNLPATLKYEPGTIVAEGDYVIVHGRFPTPEGRGIGSLPTLSASPMTCSRSTGTFCRTKQPKLSRKAVCRCSGPNFSAEIMGESSAAAPGGFRNVKAMQRRRFCLTFLSSP